MGIINNHDFEKIKKEYEKNKYITIDNFLDEEVANDVYQGLLNITEKNLWYQANHGSAKHFNKDISIDNSNYYHFSYRYEMFPLKNYSMHTLLKGNISRKDMLTLNKIFDNPEMELSYAHNLRKIGDFFDSSEMHDLISHVTSNSLSYHKALCFASRFTSHNFLSLHNDGSRDIRSARRVAFILNMTKDWLIHWGGNLVILNKEADEIIEAHIPKFNSLVLFDVPLNHLVLPVSTNCQSERFAITGWYQNKSGDDL